MHINNSMAGKQVDPGKDAFGDRRNSFPEGGNRGIISDIKGVHLTLYKMPAFINERTREY